MSGSLSLRALATSVFAGVVAFQMLVAPSRASDPLLLAAADASTMATDGPIVIGLDAALSGGSGQSGEAIRRGLVIAMHEINEAGGVLGRKLTLVQRDNRGLPDRGVDNIHELAEIPNLVAVFGGISTPVALAELPAIHETETLYLGPWAAGTPVIDNGFEPNFVFRVSVRDQHAGPFLIKAALDRGFKRPGLLLWRTGWGRSNEAAMTNAMEKMGVVPAGTEWFNTSERDLSDQIEKLVLAGADVIMLVANSVEGLSAVEAMAARPEAHRLPIISHWGITGGDFFGQGRTAIEAVDLTFLQTYSFYQPIFPHKSDDFYRTYCKRFGPCTGRNDIFSPVGTAHAYDLAYLLKAAIEKAGTINRAAVRDAMENLQRHEGLVRVYDPPFTAARHDALDASDFRLCRYGPDGEIMPLSLAQAD